MSLEYYIYNKILLFEWSAFSPDFNSFENVWANNKYKLGVNAKNTVFEVRYWRVLDKLCKSFKQYHWRFYEKKIMYEF